MLCTLTAATLLAVAAAVDDPTKGPQPPVLTFKEINKNGSLVFEVANPNKDPLPYLGYAGAVSPLYQLQWLKGKDWQEESMGWCGNGVGGVSIPAQGKATFKVQVEDGDWDQVRVGFYWYKMVGNKRVWVTTYSAGVPRAVAVPKK